MLWCKARSGGRNRVPKKVLEKVLDKLCEAVRFNRVPENVPEKVPGSLDAKPSKVPEKVPEKVEEALPSQVQQGSGEGSEKFWKALVQSPVRFNRVPEKVLVRVFFEPQLTTLFFDSMKVLGTFDFDLNFNKCPWKPVSDPKTRCSPRTRMLTRMLMVQMSKDMDMQSRRTLFCNSLFEQSCTYFPCYQSAVWTGKCSVECGV